MNLKMRKLLEINEGILRSMGRIAEIRLASFVRNRIIPQRQRTRLRD